MSKSIKKIYGDALFELAVEENQLDTMLVEIESLKRILVENKMLRQILSHPGVDEAAKISLVEQIFKGKCSDCLIGFLVLVIRKGRQAELNDIFNHFIERGKEEKAIGRVFVTSAVELSENEKKAIEQRLLGLTKYQRFNMNFTVDERILGGLIIRIGDRVTDSSIRTKLLELKKSLVKNEKSE